MPSLLTIINNISEGDLLLFRKKGNTAFLKADTSGSIYTHWDGYCIVLDKNEVITEQGIKCLVKEIISTEKYTYAIFRFKESLPIKFIKKLKRDARIRNFLFKYFINIFFKNHELNLNHFFVKHYKTVLGLRSQELSYSDTACSIDVNSNTIRVV